MPATVTTGVISSSEIHPELAAIEREFRAGVGSPGSPGSVDPYHMSQSYNISQCDPSDVYVTLQYPNDGGFGWEEIARDGDLGCVRLWNWAPHSGPGVARAVITWQHPGSLLVTYRSVGWSPYPGNDILYFRVFAC